MEAKKHELLLNCAAKIQHNNHAFAMLHNASAIRDSSWEGMHAPIALRYLDELLNLDEASYPIPLGISQDQLNITRLALKSTQRIYDLFNSFNSTTGLNIDIDKTIAKINEEAANLCGLCYVYSGWANDEGEAHFNVVRLRHLHDSVYACTILDRGAGIGFHHPTHQGQKGAKVKRKYALDEFSIDLQSEFGRFFLEAVIRLNFDRRPFDVTEKIIGERFGQVVKFWSNKKTIRPYDVHDLYGLLVCCGEPLNESSAAQSTTPQRTGTCPITNSLLIVTDSLLNIAKCSSAQSKRTTFVIKLTSLIEANKAYKQDNCPHKLFAWAVRETDVRLTKHYQSLLDDDEIQVCTELVGIIQQSYRDQQNNIISMACAPDQLPPLTGVYDITAQPSTQRQQHGENQVSDQIVATAAIPDYHIFTPTPEQVLEYLRTTQQHIENKYSIHTRIFLYEVMRSLPPTSGNQVDAFWDQVPQAHLSEIIDELVKLTALIHRYNKLPGMQMLEFALIAYDICAQIAPRLPELHLDKSFVLGLSDVVSKDVFTEASVYFSIKQILLNFQRRQAGKKCVFTNVVKPNCEDATIEWLCQWHLTKQVKSQTLQLLKDKSAVKSSVYSLHDNYYINVLLTRSCIAPNPSFHDARYDQSTKVDEFPTEAILSPLFVQLLHITKIVHGGDGAKSYEMRRDAQYEADPDLCFNKQTDFYQQTQLKEALAQSQSEDFNGGIVGTTLMKHAPNSRRLQVEFGDYAENAIYHPVELLRELKEKNDPWNFNKPVEFTPYQHKFSGSLATTTREMSEYDIPKNKIESLDEALKQIEAAGVMQIPLLLEWCQYHIDNLVYTDVQNRIKDLLFTDNKLDFILCHHHEDVLPLFTLFFNTCVKYYQDRLTGEGTKQQRDALVFLIDLQREILEYVKFSARIYHFNVEKFKIVDPRETLQRLVRDKRQYDSPYQQRKAKIIQASLLFLYYQYFPLENLEEMIGLVSTKLLTSLDTSKGYNDYSSLDVAVIKTWRSLYQQIDQRLQSFNASALNDFMNAVLKNALGDTINSTWSYHDSIVTCTSPKITIRLKNGAMYNEHEQVSDITDTMAHGWAIWERLNLKSLNLTILNQSKTIKQKDTVLNIATTADYSWEFHFYPGTGRCWAAYRLLCINDANKRFKLLASSGDDVIPSSLSYCSSKQLTNPFGDDAWNGMNCINSFWVNTENDDEIFVEFTDYNGSAYHYTPSQGWMRLARDEKGKWVKDNYIILDVCMPRSQIEKQWKMYLDNTIGVHSVSVHAQLINDREILIQKMLWDLLGLSFINRNAKLECDSHPGFYLTAQKSLPCLQGLTSLIVLENDQGERRYLLPAYKLQKHDKNVALEESDFFNKKEVLEQRCFEYTLDQNNELRGMNIDADLYLAVIYRCLGDYARAMQSLAQTQHYQSNRYAQAKIIDMLLLRKDLSPLGAAFDCQVAIRMYHHDRKWDQKEFYRFIKSDFARYVMEQFDYYQQNISERREGICIMPYYLKLTHSDYEIIEAIRATRIRNDQKKSGNWGYRPEQLGLRVVRFGVNLDALCNDESIWFCKKDVYVHGRLEDKAEEWVKHHPAMDCQPPTPLQPLLRHYYDWQDAKLDELYLGGKQADHPSISPSVCFVEMNFLHLFHMALETDPAIEKRLKLTLFTLRSNEKKERHDDVNVLSHVMLNRQNFISLKGKFNSNRACMVAVYTQMRKLYDTQKLITGSLIQAPEQTGYLSALVSLPAILPTNQAMVFSLDNMAMSSMCAHPLKSIMDSFFNHLDEPIAKTDKLPISSTSKTKRLEKELVIRLENGHAQNLSKMRTVYSLKNTELNLDDLKTQLSSQRDHSVADAERLQQAILLLANKKPDGSPHQKALSAYLIALQRSEQIPEITLPFLLEAFLQQDVNRITNANVFLNQSDINEILQKLCEYMVANSLINLCDEAKEIIQDKQSFADLSPYHLQELARTLDKQRHYKIAEYPEFLSYEYYAKKWIRQDQYQPLDALIRHIEGEIADIEEVKHALLQFKAGGGKTWLLIPLLAFRFSQQGFLPMIFNTNELHHISLHELPAILRNTLKKHIEIIDRDLNHKWTLKELEQLLSDIHTWREGKRILMITPTVWHSLNTTKRIAYDNNEEDIAKAAFNVLNYFKQWGVKLEDEGHIQSDPLQQSIKTYGKMQSIPIEQQQVLIDYFDILLGVADNAKHIADIAGIIDKGKKAVTAEELQQLQQELTDRVVGFACYSTLDAAELRAYFSQKDRKKPEWLKTCRQKSATLASLVVLGRTLLHTLLEHILTLQFQKDFGKSIHEKDLTVAPKHDGKDVTAHFADQILVAALTIELYATIGVPATDTANYILEIIQTFERLHLNERRWNSKNITKAEISFNAKLPESYGFISLDGLSSESKMKISADPAVRYSPAMQKFFLFTYAFRQIRTPEFRVESTPADLQAGFKRSIIFTATPGCLEVYPVYLERGHYYESASFEAEVVQTMIAPKNSGHCLIDMTHDPKQMFQQIKLEYHELFLRMQALFERGALFSDITPTKVAEAILASFDENDERRTVQCFENNLMTLKSKDAQLNDVKIPGTNVIHAIKRQGLDPKRVLLFLFLDLIKTTGTDIKRPYNDVAGITIGKGQTLSVTIQAAMRNRQLLEQDAQTLIWLIFNSLYRQISPESEQFDLVKISSWFIENEAEELKTKVINRAYQGIYEIIVAKIWSSIDHGQATYQDYQLQLQQRYPMDPYVLYEVECIYDQPQFVLGRYRDFLCQRFGLSWENDFTSTQQRRINRIIDESQQLIELMREPHGAELNAQVCQEQTSQVENEKEVEQEQRLKSMVQVGKDFRFRLERYSAHDTLAAIFQDHSNRFKRIQFDKCHFKLPKLLLSVQDFSPFDHINNRISTVKYLKPVQTIILEVNIENHKFRFAALTIAAYQFYAQKIRECVANNLSYSIIGFDGHILCSSKNTTEDLKSAILSNIKLKRILTFCALLNGYIKDPATLREVALKYQWNKTNFDALISAIQEVQVTRSLMSMHSIQNFEAECGWRKLDSPIKLSEQKQTLFTQNTPDLALVAIKPADTLPERISAERLVLHPKSVLPCVLFEQTPRLLTNWEVKQ